MGEVNLIKLKMLAAIRYLNGDYREFLRLEREAIMEYRRLQQEEKEQGKTV